MALPRETLQAVEDALISIYGFTLIERRSSLELQSVETLPYATLIVAETSYDAQTIGTSGLQCEVTGAVLFKSEKALLDAMDTLQEFRDELANTVDVTNVVFTRLNNATDSKKFNYAMSLSVTTQGNWG